MMIKIVNELDYQNLKGNLYDTIHVLNKKRFNYYDKDVKNLF